MARNGWPSWVGDGDDGLLVAPAFDEPPVLGREVGVACPHRAAGTLDERLAERPVGKAGAPAQALARALVGPRSQAGPGRRGFDAPRHRYKLLYLADHDSRREGEVSQLGMEMDVPRKREKVEVEGDPRLPY
jgi:hypothetical protein